MMRTTHIGHDRVELADERLVIHSTVDMERWEVLRYRKPLIHHGGRTWTLVGKERATGGAIRYELEPWTPEATERPGYEIHYGAEFVASRDRQLAIDRAATLATPIVWFAMPLIGQLWSGTRRRLELNGIDPVASVRAAVFAEYLLLVMAAAYVTVMTLVAALGHGPPAPPLPGLIAILILLPDTLMRYDRLLGEERYPPGFYEWLWLWVARRRP